MRRVLQQPPDEVFDPGLDRPERARRECRSQQFAHAGMNRRIVEHQTGGVMFIEQAVAEVRPEIDFLVRTPRRGVAIDPHQIVIAGQEQRSVGQTMDRRGLAQRRVDRIGIVQKPGIEMAKVKAADDVGAGSGCGPGRVHPASGYAAPARSRSWKCTMPTGRPASTTISAVIFELLSSCSASLTS